MNLRRVAITTFELQVVALHRAIVVAGPLGLVVHLACSPDVSSTSSSSGGGSGSGAPPNSSSSNGGGGSMSSSSGAVQCVAGEDPTCAGEGCEPGFADECCV